MALLSEALRARGPWLRRGGGKGVEEGKGWL